LFFIYYRQLVGEWKRGVFVTGKWVQWDGTSFEGSFKKNKPLGRGTFLFANGNSIKGEFIEKPLKTDILKQQLFFEQDFATLKGPQK
jgi:hypothetical protein